MLSTLVNIIIFGLKIKQIEIYDWITTPNLQKRSLSETFEPNCVFSHVVSIS